MPKASSKPDNTDQATVTHEYHEHQGRRWPVLLGFVMAALIFSIILVFGGRSAYRSFINKPQPAVQTVPANANKLPKVPPASGVNGPNKNGSSTQTKQSTPSPSPSSTPASQPLPTTGG